MRAFQPTASFSKFAVDLAPKLPKAGAGLTAIDLTRWYLIVERLPLLRMELSYLCYAFLSQLSQKALGEVVEKHNHFRYYRDSLKNVDQEIVLRVYSVCKEVDNVYSLTPKLATVGTSGLVDSTWHHARLLV